MNQLVNFKHQQKQTKITTLAVFLIFICLLSIGTWFYIDYLNGAEYREGYSRGFVDYDQGKDVREIPYVPFTDRGKGWLQGYRDSREQHLTSLQK